jgi:ATP-binding cassette subfamily B protein
MCEIDEFVLKQIGGYNYKLIPKGLNLSGGQRQRIALSRAVLADTDVLVLDDALSSVDMVTEKKILNNFHQKLNDKIIILVSSKTRTLLNCDKVIILKNGKIDAFDTPKNLVNNETFIYLSEDGGCQK